MGVVPVSAGLSAQGPLEELLGDYRLYLRVERGLSEHTVLDAYERPRGCSWPGGRRPGGPHYFSCGTTTTGQAA